ncbi:Ni-sirohydrochlorin a,c-diamide synthase [Candidatus Methanoliparum sp. LAM-1]|uniref:Ni-sirohydrochlorin a,c-diamide synthase n=1 Tax=Candidatus Methanoliparum sp. LAM-1 TaxID=2874846 RepID=UPI001E4A0512|nr:Ni-sirohydrochlorin a,c-diamide synthase [Candidatus Methanoliparum sp. LAM-1]BDC35509.1 Ni-sirohydrochlorin a,c-diamide synthase [Candidatus Methanoliparum sp. LAM-1]
MDQRVLIAGDRSSAGKTTVSMGLMANLKDKGYVVQPFKVGLDYIDPSYHSLITGRPSRNIDGLLMKDERIRDIFFDATKDADISIIEGVRGLYEGYSASNDIGSTAQIAKVLKTPVILVIDARSITRSASALVKGYQLFDPEINFSGVILNHLGSKRHKEKAEEAINRYTNLEVLGSIPRDSFTGIKMRHLGLVPAKEGEKTDKNFFNTIENIKRLIADYVDIDKIVSIAKSSEDIENLKSSNTIFFQSSQQNTVKIGIAMDEAFNFYYYDNLYLLENAGAKLIYFSPIHDKKLPEVDGLYIGGGYPEFYAEDLESNKSMLTDIKRFCEREKPVFAECGGLVYLMDKMVIKNDEYSFVGLIDGYSSMNRDRRVVNYVLGKFTENSVIGRENDKFIGHEFHKSIAFCGGKNYTINLTRGEGIKDGKDGMKVYNTLATYTHFHAASFLPFAKNFVENCKL